MIAGTGGGGGQPFKLAKNDLIAELKLSHNVGGVSKLKSEQLRLQEEQERAEYKKFLAKFTMENFLEKVRQHIAILHPSFKKLSAKVNNPSNGGSFLHQYFALLSFEPSTTSVRFVSCLHERNASLLLLIIKSEI